MSESGFISLPWYIQVSLAIGYLTYNLSYTGIRFHHKQVDILFISISYSVIAGVLIILFAAVGVVEAIAVATLVTLIISFAWRYIGLAAFYAVLRYLNISWSDNSPSAWASLANSRVPLSQIAVRLTDGTWLSCVDTPQYNKLPFGPCQLGPDGDVALYLTHEQKPGRKESKITSTLDDAWGARITYIPASQIQRVTLRYKP